MVKVVLNYKGKLLTTRFCEPAPNLGPTPDTTSGLTGLTKPRL